MLKMLKGTKGMYVGTLTMASNNKFEALGYLGGSHLAKLENLKRCYG